MTPAQTEAYHIANDYATACLGATQTKVDREYQRFIHAMVRLLDEQRSSISQN